MLVACVGNQLRGDDGFGVAVAAALAGKLPRGAVLVETGIGGLGIVHHLMDGYRGLLIVDSIDRQKAAGTIFVLKPEIPEPTEPTLEDWQAQFADPHLAEPSRILRVAQAAGVLPESVLLVGCQPESCDEFRMGLGEQAAAAVSASARVVTQLVSELLVGAGPGNAGLGAVSGCNASGYCRNRRCVDDGA